jgi:hypothetical protein
MNDHNCSAGILNGRCDHESHWISKKCQWCGENFLYNPTAWDGGDCDCVEEDVFYRKQDHIV